MIQSGGRWLLLLLPLHMIQSGASGLISPVNALVVLWLLLLVLPGMIFSRVLHGLVCDSLHYRGLVRAFTSLHQGLLLLTASLLLQGRVPLAAAPHHHRLVHLFTLLPHHSLFLPMVALPPRGLALISASLLYHGLVRTAASLYCADLIHKSVPLLHHGLVLIIAALRLLSLVLISASLYFLGVVLCVAPRLDSLAAPPSSQPPVSFASGRHFPLHAPALGVGTPSGCSAPGNSALWVVAALP